MRPEAVVRLVGGKDGHQTLAVLTDEGGAVVLYPALLLSVETAVRPHSAAGPNLWTVLRPHL